MVFECSSSEESFIDNNKLFLTYFQLQLPNWESLWNCLIENLQNSSDLSILFSLFPSYFFALFGKYLKIPNGLTIIQEPNYCIPQILEFFKHSIIHELETIQQLQEENELENAIENDFFLCEDNEDTFILFFGIFRIFALFGMSDLFDPEKYPLFTYFTTRINFPGDEILHPYLLFQLRLALCLGNKQIDPEIIQQIENPEIVFYLKSDIYFASKLLSIAKNIPFKTIAGNLNHVNPNTIIENRDILETLKLIDEHTLKYCISFDE